MAIKGDEPISAANLKNLADGGMLGGGVVLFEDPNANYNTNTGINTANLTKSIWDFDHIDIYIFNKSFYQFIERVPVKAVNLKNSKGVTLYSAYTQDISIDIDGSGKTITLEQSAGVNGKIAKVVGYR